MRLASILAAAVLCTVTVSAVQAQPRQAPSPQAQPPQAADAGAAVDPAKLAVARKIYALFGADTFSNISQSILGVMQGSMAKSGADAAHVQAIATAVNEAMRAVTPQVVDRSAALWAQDFTIGQLQEILAFYQSPTGQAVIAKTPEIAQQSAGVSIALLPQMVRVMQASYCRQVACTAQETQMFAALEARMRQQTGAAGG